MTTSLPQTVSLVCVVGTLPALALVLRDLRRAPQPWRRALLLITVAGLAARLLVPARWVMFYTGYELVDAAALFDPAATLGTKYGQATFALQRLVQRCTGPDLATWIAVNRLHGALIAPAAAVLLRRTGGTWRAATLAAAMLATMPLLVRDAASESQLVLVTTWLLAGAALWARICGASGNTVATWPAGLGATFLLGASLHGRPEALLLVPLLMSVVAWRTRRMRQHGAAATTAPTGSWLARMSTWLPVATVLLALGAIAAVRLAELRGGLAVQAHLGNTPKIFDVDALTLLMTAVRDGALRKSLLLRPDLTPGLLSVLLVGGVIACRGVARQMVIVWLAVALVAQGIATLDLPWLSLPRVQAPALVFGCLGAGIAADAWIESAPAIGLDLRLHTNRQARRAAALVLVWLASAAATLPALTRPTLADAEHRLIKTAYAQLRPGDVLAYRSWNDAPDERLHLHFPRTARPSGSRVIPLSALSGVLARRAAQPATLTAPAATRRVFALLGTRCHMRRCDRPGVHPACAAVREQLHLKPIVEHDVTAFSGLLPWPFESVAHPRTPGLLPDLDFPWCVRAGQLRIGLYEINLARDADADATAPARP